jgi:hypothetical protein
MDETDMNGILKRIIASIVVFLVWGGVTFSFSLPATLISGQVAGSQFENNDQPYVIAQTIMAALHGVGAIISLVFLLILLAIWWAPFKKLIATLAAAGVLFALAPADRASAYYDKADYAELIYILPSESAFFIPDVGANKDAQAAFGSMAYLEQNKIAAKRFQIPHAKISGSGAWSDFYGPSGRMYLLDRSPVSREWVKDNHRGTSPKDESFPCQTAEGLDFRVGVAISAFVTEENAAKFLYWFGVNPPQGDRRDPQVIFTSVYYGRSLAQIMDSVVRSKVQALVCNEVVKRTMDVANAEMSAMMTAIEASVKAYMDSRGISLDFIGWADTVTFAHDVQAAIDRKFIADKDAKIADTLNGKVTTIQAMATAEATRTLASKWNGSVPTSVSLWWLPTSISDFIARIGAPAKP